MAQQPGGVKRNTQAQAHYSKNSNSKNKSKQHTAHCISIDIANFINTIYGPWSVLCDSQVVSSMIHKSDNFRMTNKNTNLSTHKKIDNALQRYWMEYFFQNKMQKDKKLEIQINTILTFIHQQQNCKIKTLHHIFNMKQLIIQNPSLFLFILEMIYCQDINRLKIKLKTNQPNGIIERAKQQCEKFQTLGFSVEYTAMARFLYSLLIDNNGNTIWNDKKNDSTLNKYLKTQTADKELVFKAWTTLNKTNSFPDSVGCDCNHDHQHTDEKEEKEKEKQTEKGKTKGKGKGKRKEKEKENGKKTKLTSDGVKKNANAKAKLQMMNQINKIPIVTDTKKNSKQNNKTATGKENQGMQQKGKVGKNVKQSKRNAASDSNVRNVKSSKSDGDKVVRIDSKGRTIYQSQRGKEYYLDSSGKRRYPSNSNSRAPVSFSL